MKKGPIASYKRSLRNSPFNARVNANAKWKRRDEKQSAVYARESRQPPWRFRSYALTCSSEEVTLK